MHGALALLWTAAIGPRHLPLNGIICDHFD